MIIQLAYLLIFSPFFVQFSTGYFLTDLAFVIWNFPALGGLEYVSQKDFRAHFLCENVLYFHLLLFSLLITKL
jgi:hypothetical protein